MSQFIEMFGTVESYCKLEDLVSDTFPGEWGSEPTSENAIKVIRTTNFTNEGHLDLADVVTRDIEPKKVARKSSNKVTQSWRGPEVLRIIRLVESCFSMK